MTSIATQSRFRGCLLGGAVGDALGAPIEFMSLSAIISQFGPGGIRDFVSSSDGPIGSITDDTQMTLFTAEGIIRAYVRDSVRGICYVPGVVHHAYLRWLRTQGDAPDRCEVGMDGWLVGLSPLWAVRAPGNTCLSALRQTDRFGQPARNDSKGCGTVMRTAPVGLVGPALNYIYRLSAEIARLTHGHPTAASSTGFLSVLISGLSGAIPLQDALAAAKLELKADPNHAETLAAIELAEALAATGRADAATVERLGGGWIAEEAVAIALYAVLVTTSLEDAVVLAVNHSGDSDSTGAIAGNIAGAMYGVDAIPTRWLDRLELREEIAAVADDLQAVSDGTLDLESDETCVRYPGG